MTDECHMLETIDGKTQAMFRKDPWHHLGTVVGEQFSYLDAIANDLSITWPVEKVALADLIGHPSIRVPDDTYVALRKDGSLLHAGHGTSWTPYPPEQAYEFVQFLRDEFGVAANLESLATIRNGKQWFMSFGSGEFQIGGFDIRNHLTVSGSYDGSWPLQVQAHQIVAVCNNTITAVRHAGTMLYRFKNTSGIFDRVEEAKRIVTIERARTQGFMELGEKLLNVQVNATAYTTLMDALFPVDDDQPTKTQNVNTTARQSVRALYEGQANPTVAAGVEGTGWAFLQAVNTYENWGAPIRKAKGSSESTTRALRQIDATVSGKQPLTDKTLDLLLV